MIGDLIVSTQKTRQMLCRTSFLDSRIRGDDRDLAYFVISANAGIQEPIPRLIEI